MRTAALLVLALALAGCTGLHLYTVPPDVYDDLPPTERETYRPSVRPCTDGMKTVDDPRITELCDFAIIEFDDQGEFLYPDLPRRPGHLQTALDHLHEVSSPERKALVVVFVHGWKNDASPRNEDGRNLASFKKALRDLTRAQLMRCNDAGSDELCARPVMGVYMAWHGETFRTPILRFLSYFPRRDAAEAVGRVGFSHALHRIVNHAKGRKASLVNGKPKRGNPDSIVVVVGHSLGAVILENTLLRSLTMETNDFREDFPVDLAVSVNSANEAILTRQFVHALENAPKLVAETNYVRLPMIVSVSSRGDWATRWLTPPSQTVRGLGKTLREYVPAHDGPNGRERQKYYYRHTAGHTELDAGLRSHGVRCWTTSEACSRIPPTAKSAEREIRHDENRAATGRAAPKRDLFDPPALRLVPCTEDDGATATAALAVPTPEPDDPPVDGVTVSREPEPETPVRCIDSLWFRGAEPEDEGAGPEIYEIERLAQSPNRTSFWVVQLPKRIVPNHSLIFQSELVSMLAALINIPRGHEVESSDEAVAWLLGREEDAEGALRLTSQ